MNLIKKPIFIYFFCGLLTISFIWNLQQQKKIHSQEVFIHKYSEEAVYSLLTQTQIANGIIEKAAISNKITQTDLLTLLMSIEALTHKINGLTSHTQVPINNTTILINKKASNTSLINRYLLEFYVQSLEYKTYEPITFWDAEITQWINKNVNSCLSILKNIDYSSSEKLNILSVTLGKNFKHTEELIVGDSR